MDRLIQNIGNLIRKNKDTLQIKVFGDFHCQRHLTTAEFHQDKCENWTQDTCNLGLKIPILSI